jgi:two-component system, chemotaxis family, chemotaxis protein CheY
MMGSRILIIEDQDDFRELLQITLDFAGYEVVTAANGAAGLETARSIDFDLITSDIEMPVMNGIEFMKRYRAEINADTPIIVLSAAESDLKQTALAAGATMLIEKPFEPIKLSEAIAGILG